MLHNSVKNMRNYKDEYAKRIQKLKSTGRYELHMEQHKIRQRIKRDRDKLLKQDDYYKYIQKTLKRDEIGNIIYD